MGCTSVARQGLTLLSSLPDWASYALPMLGWVPNQQIAILCLGESGSGGPGRLGAGEDVVGGRKDLEKQSLCGIQGSWVGGESQEAAGAAQRWWGERVKGHSGGWGGRGRA